MFMAWVPSAKIADRIYYILWGFVVLLGAGIFVVKDSPELKWLIKYLWPPLYLIALPLCVAWVLLFFDGERRKKK